MIVLYNGEYQEFDIHRNCNWSQILQSAERNKAQVGLTFGDFEVVSAEYDWGLLKQNNVVRCIRCGQEKSVVNLSAFMRGKGEGQLCKCRHKKEEKPPKVEYSDYVGQTTNGFKLLAYEKGRGFRVECAVCGKQKWVGGKAVLGGEVECNHRITKDYSDPSYIGKKVGSVTAIARSGRKFRFRCDCGIEFVCKPSDVFREDGVKSCGRQDCEHHRHWLLSGHEDRVAGVAFEFECADEMAAQGFKVEMTPSTGDYGVDFFAAVNGERVAFQCKKLRKESMVGAVQEVYAGGRYYDCCKFVVVSPSGFSYPAELMASKLGVQLERSLQNFQLKSLEENIIETQKATMCSGRALVWRIDGVSKPVEEWCQEYGISRTAVVTRMKRHGMDLKTALTAPKYATSASRNVIEIDGVVKTKREWCDEYGISPQLYDYRIKYSGLSPIEALTKEKAR